MRGQQHDPTFHRGSRLIGRYHLGCMHGHYPHRNTRGGNLMSLAPFAAIAIIFFALEAFLAYAIGAI